MAQALESPNTLSEPITGEVRSRILPRWWDYCGGAEMTIQWSRVCIQDNHSRQPQNRTEMHLIYSGSERIRCRVRVLAGTVVHPCAFVWVWNGWCGAVARSGPRCSALLQLCLVASCNRNDMFRNEGGEGVCSQRHSTDTCPVLCVEASNVYEKKKCEHNDRGRCIVGLRDSRKP